MLLGPVLDLSHQELLNFDLEQVFRHNREKTFPSIVRQGGIGSVVTEKKENWRKYLKDSPLFTIKINRAEFKGDIPVCN